ncbi:MAG: response regulator [Anaerolineae bacterium]|nr:response regulator [Anaerolineae bacterium]
MVTFEAFTELLRYSLAHFRNPDYQPPEALWSIMGLPPQQSVETFRQTMIQTIQSLKSAPMDTSVSLRHQRFCELLIYRYIQGLTQEETADRLGITPRHVRRQQQKATYVLARYFWEKREGKSFSSVEMEKPTDQPETEAVAWRSQVREELAALQQSAPGQVVEVATALQSVLKIGEVLASKHSITLQLEPVKPTMTVAMHATVFRQVVITALEKLVRSIEAGHIILTVSGDRHNVYLTITGTPAAVKQPPDSQLIREILSINGGSIEAYLDKDHVGFRIALPTADEVTVLVIDDNDDLVHFYQRYTTGTRYSIVHLAEGKDVLDKIDDITPDIIVLDVMLPDTDGWELLTDLQQCPTTQTLPIIVCSVVRRAELALSLGATLYLAKPVRRREFIEALDHVFNQALVEE